MGYVIQMAELGVSMGQAVVRLLGKALVGIEFDSCVLRQQIDFRLDPPKWADPAVDSRNLIWYGGGRSLDDFVLEAKHAPDCQDRELGATPLDR